MNQSFFKEDVPTFPSSSHWRHHRWP